MNGKTTRVEARSVARSFLWLALLLGVVTLAGCGSGDNSPSTSQASTAGGVTPLAPISPTPDPTRTLDPTPEPEPTPTPAPGSLAPTSPPVEPAPTASTPPGPSLYSAKMYQAPVRGEPDDLLLLPGYGFTATDTVFYQALTDTSATLAPPPTLPRTSTATSGMAEIVSVADVPHSLTVRLPAAMQSQRSYALWVRTAAGGWSQGIRINDARPLWITPDFAYETSTFASLPRQLKVVGRNLAPAPGALTKVQLSGPVTLTLEAANDADPATRIEHYVAKVTLPSRLPVGSYTVRISRDGVSWVTLQEQAFTVKSDPLPSPTFSLSNHGGCQPNDNLDDTNCIVNAIAAARNAGGGTVLFAAGVWNMSNSAVAGASSRDGIILPVGVNLRGAGAQFSTLVRGTQWSPPNNLRASFTLSGRNTVEALTFRDATVYRPSDANTPILQLGKPLSATHPGRASDIVITHNVFDKPFLAITDGQVPLDHLYITANEFGGAYSTAILLNGYIPNPFKFHLDDAVIANNTFKPSSYINASIRQGAIATQIGASRRLDFSGNLADGASKQYLYDPATDPPGWRAGFFWHMNNNHERVLISQNTATCTGDKAGDGEAIVGDNNHNSYGFAGAQRVSAATATTIKVTAPLLSPTGDATDYYGEHWLQVAQGRGLGQVRRIVSYRTDPSGTTFTVSPAWDVVPRAGESSITVTREYWQVYLLDNLTDQRTTVNGLPLCTKGNQNNPKGGAIAFASQNADSVIEGNRLYDTDGITAAASYSAGSFGTIAMFTYFLQVRHNLIEGEYDWSSGCSWSGLAIGYGAAPDLPPPVLVYGASLSDNTIIHADGLHGGAINIARGWFAGPAPGAWKMLSNTLIFRNSISDVGGPPPTFCKESPARIGINVDEAPVWRTVVSGNTCNTDSPTHLVNNKGTATIKHCPSSGAGTCECSSASLDIGVTATANESSVSMGSAVSYSVQVTNHGTLAADGIVLTVESADGIHFDENSYANNGCDADVGTCRVGTLAAGATKTMTFSGRATLASRALAAFSVTRDGADQNATNNSSVVAIDVQ